MMYDVYEVPMYHSGTFNRGGEFNRVRSFTSEQTGKTYPIKRLEPETIMDLLMLLEHDSDFAEHLYMEDVTIVHEVSGDLRFDRDGQLDEVCNQHLDGKPISTEYPNLSNDFHVAIDDVIAEEYVNGSAFD